MYKPLYRWSAGSLRHMEQLQPDMLKVLDIFICITKIDAIVIDVARTREQQRSLVASGKSKTMNSRHLLRLPLAGGRAVSHAVDLAPWVNRHVPWEDIDAFRAVSKYMFRAAFIAKVPIEWGGHFCSFNIAEGPKPWFDGPHYQLPWSIYPVIEGEFEEVA